jgi:hypothetical protein
MMIVREAGTPDFADIQDCVASTNYYQAISPQHQGGRWLVGETNGQIVACVWLMVEAPNAYLDFLAVRPGHSGAGPRLLAYTRHWLLERGIRYLRSVIKDSNLPAVRLGLAFRGALDPGYVLLYWTGDADGIPDAD